MSIKHILDAWEMVELLSCGGLDKDAKKIDYDVRLFPWEKDDASASKTYYLFVNTFYRNELHNFIKDYFCNHEPIHNEDYNKDFSIQIQLDYQGHLKDVFVPTINQLFKMNHFASHAVK